MTPAHDGDISDLNEETTYKVSVLEIKSKQQ